MQRKPYKWTKDACRAVALRFTSRTDFWRAEGSCYSQACRGGWIDEICGHMQPKANAYHRYIYAIKAKGRKVAYVGLSWNVEQRIRMHRVKGGARELLAAPHDVEIVSGPHPLAEAREAEKGAVISFEADGWALLNKAPPGALGSDRRMWTKDRCMVEARKYSTKDAFVKGSGGAAAACYLMGWMDEVGGHFSLFTLPANYWTKERCAASARQCRTRAEFRKRFDVARQIAQRNGWMDEICQHMAITKRPNGYWTKQRCREAALKYSRRGQLATGCSAAYDAAYKRGWLDDICAHMTSHNQGEDPCCLTQTKLNSAPSIAPSAP
jgi:hypothetical protein